MTGRSAKKTIPNPKIFIDTNVFFSSILWPGSVPAKAIAKAAEYGAVTSDYVIGELRRTFKAKYPDDLWRIDRFLQMMSRQLKIIETPSVPVDDESLIRDKNDHPVLRAAVSEGVAVIISGDNDLKEAGLSHPFILSAKEFLEWEP